MASRKMNTRYSGHTSQKNPLKDWQSGRKILFFFTLLTVFLTALRKEYILCLRSQLLVFCGNPYWHPGAAALDS
jgi:hypothetical protein